MFADISRFGGWMMIPLIVCSIISITVIIERFFYFQKLSQQEQADQVLILVNSGKLQEGLKLAQNSNLPVMRILSAGIINPAEPVKAMEAVGISEQALLKRGLPTLDTIITLAPLLGLLGTILGMINSFQVMALVGGGGSPHAVTGGVAEALIATATGIGVAATTLIPYNYFQARVEKETEVIEHYSTQLEVALLKQ